MAFVYAWIVPLWADQLLPQLLMEQFDILPIQCRHIEHMHEGVYNFFVELRQLFPYMAFVYAWIVPLWADQLLPQLLMEQFDTLPIQCRHIEHMHEGVYNFFVELRQLFPYMAFVYAWIVPLWANQLLPQLLMEQFDTLPIQCRHIEHMHEGVYNFFVELRQLFPYMAFVYAWIVPLWANQLLLQLLMEQFDTLPIQCRHIEHMHEGVYNFCFFAQILLKCSFQN